MAESRAPAGLAIAALCLIAAAVWWLKASPTEVSRPDSVPAPAAASPTPAGETPRTSAAPRSRSARVAPLPPPGTPLSDIIGPLQARADAGDSLAACRLAMELLRCQHLAHSLQYIPADDRPIDVVLAERGRLEAADAFAELEIRRVRLGQHCEAVDPALLAQAPTYLAQAARAGEPEAMVRYATGAQHGILGGHGFVRGPAFDQWRRESPAMLLRAVQAGRLDAVNLLGYAYRSDGEPFAGLVPDDPVQGHAWGLLVARLTGAGTAPFEIDDPAVQAQAEALASDWHQRYFDSIVLDADSKALQMMPLHLPREPLDQTRLCEPGAGAGARP